MVKKLWPNYKTSKIFLGFIGVSNNLFPVASFIAFPTAANGGTIGTSPTPLTPNGCKGLGTSTSITSIFGISKDTVWILKRSSLLFVLPTLYSVEFSKKVVKTSIFMFFISMFLSSLIAIGINYDIIYKIDDITKLRYAAFLKYTDHNVFLVISIILSIFSVIHIKMKNNFRYIILFFIPVYLFSFITERGVAAWIIFIIFISVLLVYIFRKNITLAILSFCGILLCSYFIYNNSQVIQRMITYKTKHILTDERIVFLDNTLELIESQPIKGYGPGTWRDVFDSKYDKSILIPLEHNTPHNNYLYVWMELGILGLILLLSIFYFHIREIYQKGIIAILFPFMFLILMLFDSYLFSQNTLILYIIFSIISVNFQNKLA